LTARVSDFVASIKLFNGNPFVYVSAARARAIKPDWRKPLPVLVRINGEPSTKPWRINMMPIGNGAFYLYLESPEGEAGLGRADSQSQEGDSPLLLVAQVPGSPCPQRGARPACAIGQGGALHGAFVVSRPGTVALRSEAQ
jgi:hypothetical protein